LAKPTDKGCMSVFHGKALLIDQNLKLINDLKEKRDLMEKYPFLMVRNYKEAEVLLKNEKYNIRIAFISTATSMSHGLEEIKLIREMRPAIPLFLISHDPSSEPAELKAPMIGVQGLIEQPKKFEELIKHLDELFKGEKWDDVKPDSNQKNAELDLKDEEYIRTSLKEFILTKNSFFNLYIRLSGRKFVKIVNAGDQLSSEILETYAKKGMEHIYVPIDEHKKYLALCDEMSKKILQKSSASNHAKLDSILHFGSRLSESYALKGITPEKLDLAESFLTQSVAMVRSLRLQRKEFKDFMDLLEQKEHCSAVAFIASLLGNEVGFESTKCVKVVGLAALMHDIGLYTQDPDFNEEKSELTEEEQKIFESHAQKGAELLRSTGQFEEVVIQAVELHHYRRRSSDPSKRSHNINMITEIIGAADEIHNLSLNIKDQTNWNLFITDRIKDFSPQVEKAVKKVLNLK
jgi:putative nucleotidyltransferase with HDIG domain